jgi:hypothetical protein
LQTYTRRESFGFCSSLTSLGYIKLLHSEQNCIDVCLSLSEAILEVSGLKPGRASVSQGRFSRLFAFFPWSPKQKPGLSVQKWKIPGSWIAGSDPRGISNDGPLQTTYFFNTIIFIQFSVLFCCKFAAMRSSWRSSGWSLAMLAVFNGLVQSNRQGVPISSTSSLDPQFGCAIPRKYALEEAPRMRDLLLLRLSGGAQGGDPRKERKSRPDASNGKDSGSRRQKTASTKPSAKSSTKDPKRILLESIEEKKMKSVQQQNKGKRLQKDKASSSNPKPKEESVQHKPAAGKKGVPPTPRKMNHSVETGADIDTEEKVFDELKKKSMGSSAPSIVTQSTFSGLFEISPPVHLPGHTGLTLEHFRAERLDTDTEGEQLEKDTYRYVSPDPGICAYRPSIIGACVCGQMERQNGAHQEQCRGRKDGIGGRQHRAAAV